ncbi:mediator of RNA polymerase II transcription subunit 14 [Naviculisporaceae sp. PSN 640]
MENGTQNGVRTNHDREPWLNGVNGGVVKREISPDGGKMMGNMTNGGGGSSMELDGEIPGRPSAKQEMEDIEDEIRHITQDFIPLSLILTRLAQFSFARLNDTIHALSNKPLPQPVANGASGNYQTTAVEDPSEESREKKTIWLKTMEELHHKWVKALVITEWSKKAHEVGTLIDIKCHLHDQVFLIEQIFNAMLGFKQSLHRIRTPSPDLKTALEILSSGEVSWMSDLGYLKPPPLTDRQNQEWLEELNTLLSVRLSYDDYDKLPLAFRDYTISDGRVTFRVPGEFELDVTIDSEDFSRQYYFLDFRFLFSPAPQGISERMRSLLDLKVNVLLGTEGLEGCYKFLHEFVLTQKITEFWRQAHTLSMARWIDSLKIERLHRSLSIQYWRNRPYSKTTKSWIILGVHSGDLDGVHQVKLPSRLSLRWFRDGKEVPATDITFDVNTISTEDLLTTVIAHHTEYYLSSMAERLLSKPRFAKRYATLDLVISKQKPEDSALTMQLYGEDKASLGHEPITGSFFLLPRDPIMLEAEDRLNASNNPAEEGPNALEKLRWIHLLRELQTRARCFGWTATRPQLQVDDLKKIVYSTSPTSREPFQSIWLRKLGWSPQWFVMASLSLGGDQWFLVNLTTPNPGTREPPRVKTYTKIPMTSAELTLSEKFFDDLSFLSVAIVAQLTDLRELHSKKLAHIIRESRNFLDTPVVPIIYIRLSDMLRSRGAVKEHPMPWAKDYIQVAFKGFEVIPEEVTGADGSTQYRRGGRSFVRAEARLDVEDKGKFRLLKRKIDNDVFFDARRGQFILRLRANMGVSFVNTLGDRIKSLERVVDFVDAIRRAGEGAMPGTVTLREVSFTYSRGKPPLNGQQLLPWLVRLDLAHEDGVKVELEPGNPHMRVLTSLETIARSKFFENLPGMMVLTLPLYRGLEAIEEEWSTITLQSPGHSLTIFPRELGWVGLRFTYPGAARRLLTLEIRHKVRRGNMVWHVSRSEHADPSMPGGRRIPGNPMEAEFDRLLTEKVWSVKAPGIKSLGNGAAAHPETGIEALLSIISNAAKSYIGTPPPPQLHNNPGVVGIPGGGGGIQQQQQQPPQQQDGPPPPRPNTQQHQQPAPMPNLNNRFAQQRQQQQQQAMMGGHGQMHPGQQGNQHQQGGNQNRGPVGTKNNAVVVLD